MRNDSVFLQGITLENYLLNSYKKSFADDLSAGLSSKQKFIPSKYLYDARGSELFQEICMLPEYYPAKTEMTILKRSASDIMNSFCGDLVELGSGASSKIRILLDTVRCEDISSIRYIPFDVSESSLRQSASELAGLYPGLRVHCIAADFNDHMRIIPAERPRLFFFLGSTIGNFNVQEQSDFLRAVSDAMKPCDRIFIGFDMVKQRSILEAAYNDSRGITSEFNKNILHVINRVFHSDLDPEAFSHLAFYNDKEERIEMHLRAERHTKIEIDSLGLKVNIKRGETIHTENSFKFSRGRIEEIIIRAGLKTSRWYSDKRGWFSLLELIAANNK